MDAREWTGRHGPLTKRQWCTGCFGAHAGPTCGEMLHGVSHPLLVHASFPALSMACYENETLELLALIMHHPALVVANQEAKAVFRTAIA